MAYRGGVDTDDSDLTDDGDVPGFNFAASTLVTLTARAVVLGARGWVAPRRYWRMRRELDTASPEPVWPVGVVVRHDDRPRDDVDVHALISTSFREIGGQHERTLASWSAHLLDSPQVRPVALPGGGGRRRRGGRGPDAGRR